MHEPGINKHVAYCQQKKKNIYPMLTDLAWTFNNVVSFISAWDRYAMHPEFVQVMKALIV